MTQQTRGFSLYDKGEDAPGSSVERSDNFVVGTGGVKKDVSQAGPDL